MEKERGYKVVAIIALLIAVVGVGIGFAAFSATFTINEETVTVNPSENLLENGMHYTGFVGTGGPEGAGGDTVTYTNNGTATGREWSGIQVEINGDYGMPTLGAEFINESNYDAYITGLSTVAGGTQNSDKVVCVAEEGTNQALVDEYCKAISVTVGVADDTFENMYVENGEFYFTSENAMNEVITSGNFVPAGGKGYVLIQAEIKYGTAADPVTPDGPFKIYIPTIHFDFSTAKPAQTN